MKRGPANDEIVVGHFNHSDVAIADMLLVALRSLKCPTLRNCIAGGIAVLVRSCYQRLVLLVELREQVCHSRGKCARCVP